MSPRGVVVATAGTAAVAAASYWGVAGAVIRPGRRLLGDRPVLCSVRTARTVLALTFDDGPDRPSPDASWRRSTVGRAPSSCSARVCVTHLGWPD